MEPINNQNPIPMLTTEQQFKLAWFTQTIRTVNAKQAQDIAIEVFRQSLVKETYYRGYIEKGLQNINIPIKD